MILEIVKYGTPVLREKGRLVKEVDDKVKDLAENMIETMRAANGVGLAAQQVGVTETNEQMSSKAMKNPPCWKKCTADCREAMTG